MNPIGIAKAFVTKRGDAWDSNFESILRFCIANRDFFPRKGKLEIASSRYIEKYVSDYYSARYARLEGKEVATKPDPIVDYVLMSFFRKTGEQLPDITEAHRISMAAENLVGPLLERYVASGLEKSGWIWCCGETMRAVDFLKEGPATRLLQIKNRDNSENSSSASIRKGTNIEKWHRIVSRTGMTKWEELPGNEPGILSESGFTKFVLNYPRFVLEKLAESITSEQ